MANNRNAIVNTEPTVSETPADLVAEKAAPELSPNPAGFGFTKQVQVDSLAAVGSPRFDTLYLVRIYDVNGHVKDFYRYRWTCDKAAGAEGARTEPHWERVFNPVNNVKHEDGEHVTPVHENTAPKTAPEKIFTGKVVFNREPTIEGKKLHDWVDSEGGVTQEELDAALGNYYKKTETYDKTQIDNLLDEKQDLLSGATTPEGTANKLVGLDSNGNLVQSPLPEGTVVVDEDLDANSTNPVENKAVAAKFNEVDENLETKAKVDGNYPTMTVGVADNLSPYDEESGIKQHAPFNFQASGTNNGGDATATVGSLAMMNEKRGNSVVVNQAINESSRTATYFGMTLTVSNGTHFVIGGTSSYPGSGDQNIYLVSTPDVIQGHKYLCASTSSKFFLNIYTQGGVSELKNYEIFTPNASGEGNIAVKPLSATYIANGTVLNESFDVYFIDLTQWFNGDIPQDLLNNPDHFFRYYQGSLAYNEGTLVNANSRYLKAIGRNQWDEETLAGYYNDSNGAFVSDSRYFCSKNPIKVIPNTTYNMLVFAGKQVLFYDKDLNYISATGNSRFTTPANCCYIHFWVNSATYNHDITISIYYDGESGYDQYYPYKLLTNNDTGVEILRSAGSAADSKAPDGTITRRIGTYTFTGNESWTAGSNGYYSSVLQDNLAKSIGYSDKANVTSDAGLVATSRGNIVDGVITDGISVTDNLIYVSNNAGLAGKTIYYELAEPTTEQGTPYSENVAIDDFGTMDFSGTSGVPQGNNLFYPVDYKAYLDTLHNYTDGDPDNLALKSDLVGYEKYVDLSNEITDSASLTYQVKKACKIGNMYALEIYATNNTGNTIANGTTLFTLGDNLKPNTYQRLANVSSPTSNAVAILGTDGAVSLNNDISSGGVLVFNTVYFKI